MAELQPFDPGYDYEADKDIVERLEVATGRLVMPLQFEPLLNEAACEIRALRLLIKNMERTINNLLAERVTDENEFNDINDACARGINVER